MLIFLVQTFNQNDLTNNLNGLRKEICPYFSIVVSIFLDTSPPVCSAECQDAAWNICTQVGLWTHNRVPFLTGENWVSLLFFIAVGDIFKFDCVEGLWNVTTSTILHGGSLNTGAWFSKIPLHHVVSSSPQSSHPDQVTQMLSYRIMKCFPIQTLWPPFPCPGNV